MLALAGAERIFEVLDKEPEIDEGKVTLEKVENDYNWVLPDGKRVPLRGDVRFNNVDFAYTNARGIGVANVPSYSTDSVAQHTFSLLLYLVEKMRYFDDYVKSGRYSKSSCFSCLDMIYPEIAGKTWGIIGMGAIGQKVAQIATVFGCKVITYSASGKTYDMPYEQVDFDTLLAKSDILSIHTPLNEYTKDATVLIVAQRIGTIMNADKIIVLN